jgi:phosphoribosylaminoimidazole (AIR) synthetase
MAQVGGQELRDVVVTGIGPVFLLDETRVRWNRAEERERVTVGLFEGARPCGPLTFSQQPVTA